MNIKVLAVAPLLGGLLLLSGCGNTLSGAKQDASSDSQAVQQAGGQVAQDAQKTAADVKQTAADAGTAAARAARGAKAAAVLTPLIKTAIIRDPVLNDPHNLVNVSTDADVVHLTGHVTDPTMKPRAEQDAQVVLTHHHAAQTVTDDLTVTGS